MLDPRSRPRALAVTDADGVTHTFSVTDADGITECDSHAECDAAAYTHGNRVTFALPDRQRDAVAELHALAVSHGDEHPVTVSHVIGYPHDHAAAFAYAVGHALTYPDCDALSDALGPIRDASARQHAPERGDVREPRSPDA